MNEIFKYNSILIKYILIVSITILLGIVIYNLWLRTKYLEEKEKKKEHFSQVSLEKQVRFYDDYRNYIDGKNHLTSRFLKNKRLLPYIVNSNCFVKNFNKCMFSKTKDKNYPQAKKITTPLCQDLSLDKCVYSL